MFYFAQREESRPSALWSLEDPKSHPLPPRGQKTQGPQAAYGLLSHAARPSVKPVLTLQRETPESLNLQEELHDQPGADHKPQGVQGQHRYRCAAGWAQVSPVGSS